MSGELIVSIHDVAPGSAAESRAWLKVVEQYGLRASLLVIAGPWRGGRLDESLEFVRWLHECEEAGHEIVLHGWEHRQHPVAEMASGRGASIYGRVRARGCAEFHGLDRDTARRLLDLSSAVMRRCGFDPVGFTPPGWLASPAVVEVLTEMGFAYTTTQWAVHDLQRGVRTPMLALSQRPGSLATRPAAALNESVARHLLERNRRLRIALHPDDLQHHVLRSVTAGIFSTAVTCRATSLTYGDLVQTRLAA